jgi:hypothetical protein
MRVLQAFTLHLVFVFEGCILVTFGCSGYLLMTNSECNLVLIRLMMTKDNFDINNLEDSKEF